MGVLIRMPESRFQRTPFKTHGSTIVLTKCKKCGARRVVSFADGSVYRWENNHECASANAPDVKAKRSAGSSNDAGLPLFWGIHRPS